ncbi:MAG: hypothetical protein IJO48_03440 [Clostridia bacterium]|nr:hypothetical protein [Clostridia bacterium]
MKKSVIFVMITVLSLSLCACLADPEVLLVFSEGTLEKIEYDVVLKAHFTPDNLLRNHGFEQYIKYYFKDDKLIACDHVYEFETEKEALDWREKYSYALDRTEGCYVDGKCVVKNELSPPLLGRSCEEITDIIEYSFHYIDSEIIPAL